MTSGSGRTLKKEVFCIMQVIIKPDPGNPQELYLDSLAALGMSLNLSKTTNENISIL
jgi:glycyl-tRNA synthetase alpha subunit